MKPNILVAKDNIVNQKLIRAILSRAGLSSDLVIDGEVAVSACASGNYDLVLMDVNMLVMDGLDAANGIRQLPIKQPIIMAVTAMAMVGDRERWLQSGMDGYLARPFTASPLLEDVQASLHAATSYEAESIIPIRSL